MIYLIFYSFSPPIWIFPPYGIPLPQTSKKMKKMRQPYWKLCSLACYALYPNSSVGYLILFYIISHTGIWTVHAWNNNFIFSAVNCNLCNNNPNIWTFKQYGLYLYHKSFSLFIANVELEKYKSIEKKKGHIKNFNL